MLFINSVVCPIICMMCVQCLLQKYPSLFGAPPFPYTWNNPQTDVTKAHSETPMHLLFLGHCKGCLKFTLSFLKSRQQDTKFRTTLTESAMLDLIGSWNLGWCAALDFGNGSFGGFISDNYVGAARLLPWFMNMVDQCCYDESIDEEHPNGEKLSVAQLRQWLRRRGSMACNDEDRDIMLISFYEMMEEPAEHPIVDHLRTCTIVQMNRTLHALFFLISNLMSATNASCRCPKTMLVRTNLVKLYLSAYMDAESAMLSNRANPSWTTKPNMMGLFNLVKNMPHVGIPRSIWEGGKMGEGMLPKVKQRVHGLRKNWQDTTMKRVAQDRSYSILEKVVHKSESKNTDSSEAATSYSLREFSSYSSLDNLKSDMESGQPLTGFIFESIIYILIRDKYNSIRWDGKCYILKPIGGYCYKWGYHYCKYSIGNEVPWSNFFRDKKLVGVIFLPLLHKDMLMHAKQQCFSGEYAIISSDWKIMKDDGVMSIPCPVTDELCT